MSQKPYPMVGVVGCGYWGKNLVRNLHNLGALGGLNDANIAIAEQLSETYSVPAVSFQDMLLDETIDAVLVAAPAAAHAELCARALEAQKHVFVEKPLALTTADARALCRSAHDHACTLMVGHLLQYHPAFVRLKELTQEGIIGRLQYLYSNRLNLGKIRREEDILWSFAPHDISMILSLVGSEPEAVTAVGGQFLNTNVADVTTTHLSFPGGEQAHVFVSWLHPYKEQRLVVVGDRGMLVFDDGEPWDCKLTLYRHRIDWRNGVPLPVRAEAEPIPVEPAEPLEIELRHFLSCVASGLRPRTDGEEGLRVLRVLESASMSKAATMGRASKRPDESWIKSTTSTTFIHPSAYVDEGCTIGEGTRIWHFCHLLTGSTLGRNCSLGQNVTIGPDVSIGDGCKIQNNVSIYAGVTLEQNVFCGPSCVFTNVRMPRAEVDRSGEFLTTIVRRGATIGANATIICGREIGEYAFIAAGAVVTTNVPAYALMVGIPARRVGWVSRAGERLDETLVCPRTGDRYAEVAPDRLEELPGA